MRKTLSADEVNYIFRRGSRLASGPICVVFGEESEKNGFSVVAGSKIFKKAVFRTRARRVLRSCLKDAKIRRPCVFFFRRQPQTLTVAAIKSDVDKLISHIVHHAHKPK